MRKGCPRSPGSPATSSLWYPKKSVNIESTARMVALLSDTQTRAVPGIGGTSSSVPRKTESSPMPLVCARTAVGTGRVQEVGVAAEEQHGRTAAGVCRAALCATHLADVQRHGEDGAVLVQGQLRRVLVHEHRAAGRDVRAHVRRVVLGDWGRHENTGVLHLELALVVAEQRVRRLVRDLWSKQAHDAFDVQCAKGSTASEAQGKGKEDVGAPG